MQNQTFKVEGMHCPACVMRIEGIEDELPGIDSIKASYKKDLIKVSFDENQVSNDQIIAAVDLKGYRASLMGSNE